MMKIQTIDAHTAGEPLRLIVDEAAVGEFPAIVPEIEGEAYITGENTFIIDDRDPLRYGFRL